MYTVTQLFLRASQPEGWKGEWIEKHPIGSGFFLQLDHSTTILVTCKHIIEDRASFLPEAALVALPIENWSIETFGYKPSAEGVVPFKPSVHTFTLLPEEFVALKDANLTAARVEKSITALEMHLLPSTDHLTAVVDTSDKIHSMAFPWPAESVNEGGGAGAGEMVAPPVVDAESMLPVLLTGNLAFPPHIKFRGKERGVFTTSGSDLASTGGSPLLWWTLTVYNRAERSTRMSQPVLLLMGIHSEGPEERKLRNNGGNALSFYIPSNALRQFSTVFMIEKHRPKTTKTAEDVPVEPETKKVGFKLKKKRKSD